MWWKDKERTSTHYDKKTAFFGREKNNCFRVTSWSNKLRSRDLLVMSDQHRNYINFDLPPLLQGVPYKKFIELVALKHELKYCSLGSLFWFSRESQYFWYVSRQQAQWIKVFLINSVCHFYLQHAVYFGLGLSRYLFQISSETKMWVCNSFKNRLRNSAIWVRFPMTVKLSKMSPFFEASLRPNGLIFFKFS